MASIISAGTTSATALNMSADTTGILQLASNNGTVALTVDTSQNVLIGGASSLQSAALSVYGAVSARNGGVDGAFANAFIGVYSGNSNEHNVIQTAVSSSGAGSGFRFLTSNGAGLSTTKTTLDLTRDRTVFYNDGTERARIDSGILLVGKTANTAGVVGFVVNGNGTGGATFTLAGTNEIFVWDNTATTGTAIIDFRTANVSKGRISWNNSNTTYGTTSDYRLKENVQPMVGALAKVAALKPCTYTWKDGGKSGQGFIAHELAEVVPECVTGEKDATRMEEYEVSSAVPATYDEDGNQLTQAVEAVMGEREVPFHQNIDTSFLVATLTAAIQELNAKVTALEEQVLNLGVK